MTDCRVQRAYYDLTYRQEDKQATHILDAVAILLIVSNVELENCVEHIQYLSVVDDLLVGEVAHTSLNERLQDEVHQLHGLPVNVIVEVLVDRGEVNMYLPVYLLIPMYNCGCANTHTCANSATSPTRLIVRILSFCSLR